MKVLDLFSGIGGFSLGLHRADMETVAFCEIEPYPQAVLRKNFPGVPIYDDVRTVTAERLRADGIDTVDLVCGGFPCQPFSTAGKRGGKEDDRYLWPEMYRIIKELRPSWVIGENVTGLIDLALEDCLIDLGDAGYEVQSFIIPACAIEAYHQRDRVWIVANSAKDRRGCVRVYSSGDIEPWTGALFDKPDTEVSAEAPEAYFCDPGDGISRRLARLGWKALGNTVMPQIPEIIGHAIMAAEARAAVGGRNGKRDTDSEIHNLHLQRLSGGR